MIEVSERDGVALLRMADGKANAMSLEFCDLLTARFEEKDAGVLAHELKSRKVLVAARHGNLRVSPHFYNDETDLERFEVALKQVL